MSRQEDFSDAGIAYRMEHGKPMCIAGSNLADVERDLNRVFPFEAGAEYGYKYGIDKACEWLKNHSETDYYELIPNANYCGAVKLNKNKMIEDLCKAMEE